MKLIYGQAPKPKPRYSTRPHKYDDLWAALQKAGPGEWIGVERKDVTTSTNPRHVRTILHGAANRASLKVSIAFDEDVVFVKLADATSRKASQPVPATNSAPGVVPARSHLDLLKALSILHSRRVSDALLDLS